MSQPLLAIFRELFIYYKNIKLLRYNVVPIFTGLITVKIVIKSSSRTDKNILKIGPYLCALLLGARRASSDF